MPTSEYIHKDAVHDRYCSDKEKLLPKTFPCFLGESYCVALVPKKSTVYNSQTYDMHSRAYDDYSGSIATNTLQYSHDSAIPRAKIENHYEDIYSDHKKSAIFT